MLAFVFAGYKVADTLYIPVTKLGSSSTELQVSA